MAALESGLGGPAGFGTNTFSGTTKSAGNDDDGAVEVDISSVFGGSGIDFAGSNYSSIFINSNGVISFGAAETDYVPDLAGTTVPLLAPFWADINIEDGGEIYWHLDPVNGQVIITWHEVQPYSAQTDENSFQVILTNNGSGDFEAKFIYGDITWASGGSGNAQTGFTDGGGGDVFLDGSGNAGELEDYENNGFNGGDPDGIINLNFQGGNQVFEDGVTSGTAGDDNIVAGYTDAQGDGIDDVVGAFTVDDTVEAGDGNDTVVAGAGDDIVFGEDGDDSIEGNAGNDSLAGNDGSDTLSGGDGDDEIFGGLSSSVSAGIGGSTSTGSTFPVISLGTFADIDTNETDGGVSEDADNLFGTYGGPGAELYNNILSAQSNDLNSNNTVQDNDGNVTTSETLEVDGTPYFLDSTQVYNATVNFVDGSSGAFTAVVVQTTTGEVFLMPELSNNADNILLTSEMIESVSLNTISISNTSLNATRVDADYRVPATDTDTSGDSISGGAGNDTIFGGAGADTIQGDADDDSIDGGTGNDTITGGTGADTILGGDGADWISGQEGADSVSAGEGNDVLFVQENDTVSGDGGDDIFFIQDLGEAGTGSITIDGGTTGETSGDTINHGGLADMSTLVTSPSGGDPDAFDGSVTLLDGTVINFTNIERIICFTPNTRIATPDGEVAAQKLRPGDLVMTADKGAQPLGWVGQSKVSAMESFAPIHLAPHLTGARRPISVSPQHRILISDWRAELLFDTPEVLVPAVHFLGFEGAKVAYAREVTYIHLMLDAHEIIYAEGGPTESFHMAEEGIKAMHPAALKELYAAYPEFEGDFTRHGKTARRVLKRWESEILLNKLFSRCAPQSDLTLTAAA